MIQFLSQEWLDKQLSLLRETGVVAAELNASIQFVVTGAPDGDIKYSWSIKNGAIEQSVLGQIDNPDVTITSTWDDAKLIQGGELSPSVAFMQGRLKVGGNMNIVLSLLPITSSPEFAKVNEQLREETSV